MVRRLAMAAIGVCFFGMVGMGSANAIPCGVNECTDAGPTFGSPYSPPAAGSFGTVSVNGLSGTLPGSGFFHAFTFTLNEFSSISGDLVNVNGGAAFNILGLTLELFTAANVLVPVPFIVPNGGGNPSVAFAFGGLAAGDYLFKVSGQIDPSAKDGAYTGEFGVSEVPLPGAVWLFISAILGLVSFSRIRRNKQSA